MKKLFLLSLSIFVSLLAFSQQINKNYVTIEIVTGTWCYYCPAAANGAEDMADNGHDVAIIEYHGGDDYENPSGGTRINYYGINSYPTATFNGTTESGTGGHTGSMYSSYLATYNQMVDDLTSFDLDLNLTSADDINYSANITIDKVSDYAGTNIKLFAVITESNIQQNWQGLTHLEFVERGVYPSGNGLALDFNSETSLNEEINFSVDPSWNLENSELIVFVQDMDSKEILQVEKSIMDLPSGTNNIILQKINTPVEDEVICGNNLTPTIQIKNKGTAELTSVDFVVSVNDSEIDTYSWTGNLASLENTEIVLDEITFEQLENNELSIVAENPNGLVDDEPTNNSGTVNFSKSDETSNRIFLEMNCGFMGFQISYALFSADGTTLYSGSDFENNETVLDTFVVDIDNCYYFELYDSFNNGFSDDGYCVLKNNKNGAELINVTGNFGDLYEYNFKTTTVANIDDNISDANVSIYPNPVADIVNIKLNDSKNFNITIFSVDGTVVFKEEFNNIQNTSIDIKDFEQGIYFITMTGDINYSEKIIIEK